MSETPRAELRRRIADALSGHSAVLDAESAADSVLSLFGTVGDRATYLESFTNQRGQVERGQFIVAELASDSAPQPSARPHFRERCRHGLLVSTCRCIRPHGIRIVECPPRCPHRNDPPRSHEPVVGAVIPAARREPPRL